MFTEKAFSASASVRKTTEDYAPTGFQSPASGSEESSLDLNELCVRNPAATFFMAMSGDALIDIGCFSGDILVVDRAVTPANQDIVIAEYQGELTVRILSLRPTLALRAANPKIPDLSFHNGEMPDIFGVVTGLIRQFPRHP